MQFYMHEQLDTYSVLEIVFKHVNRPLIISAKLFKFSSLQII